MDEGKTNNIFITGHYKKYSYMLINLKMVTPADLKNLLTDAWRNKAPKRLIKDFDLDKSNRVFKN